VDSKGQLDIVYVYFSISSEILTVPWKHHHHSVYEDSSIHVESSLLIQTCRRLSVVWCSQCLSLMISYRDCC